MWSIFANKFQRERKAIENYIATLQPDLILEDLWKCVNREDYTKFINCSNIFIYSCFRSKYLHESTFVFLK